jgi:2-polyprenyl-3-methyl-5-hydroxy-6-metoxy-1,4-benzoquinol methylase
MSRQFDTKTFNRIYDKAVVAGQFNEAPDYYPRYRARYRATLQKYAQVAGIPPARVLDIGGGQHALLANLLWGDRATLADIAGPHFDYLRQQGVQVVEWNLCTSEQPFVAEFDAIFFSEVIEHLPIPGHVVLERLRIALRPGGVIICTTPNLYRLRNVVYLALGKQMYDYFRMPTDRSLGHILEYSQDHLKWQFERAGFEGVRVELCHLAHKVKSLHFRILSWFGYPLLLFPRFRDNLMVTARAPLAPAATRVLQGEASEGGLETDSGRSHRMRPIGSREESPNLV